MTINEDAGNPVNQDAVNTRRYGALMITGIVLPFLLYPFLSLISLTFVTDYTLKLTFSRLLIWGVTGLMYLYATRAELQRFILWPEEDYLPVFYIKWLVLLSLLYVAAAFFSRIPHYIGLHEDESVAIKLFRVMDVHPFLMTFSAITAGFTEEFIFRGYILSRLSLFFKNKHIAVLVSALLFAFIHITYKTLHELLFAFAIGLIFGYHYQKYRNLRVLIAMHFLIDVMAMSIAHGHK